MEITFNKRVSKGSKFNQIYLPKEMENIIEVGDLVQVKLLEKKPKIYYKNQEKLSEFKEYIVKNIFSIIGKNNEIETAFIVGSFLEDNYNDIDVILITNNEYLEKTLYSQLSKGLDQKFHIISFNKEKLKIFIETDPLIRAMFNNYISNKKINLGFNKKINWNHLNFLLMMPEDLLDLEVSSRIYFDNLRRLITIERFLNNKQLSRKIILDEILNILPENLLNRIRSNQPTNNKEIKLIKNIIKEKIKKIRSIKNGEK